MISQWAERGMLRRQHPNEPWLWRRDWSERAVRESTSIGNGCLWAFAIVWTLFTLPVSLLFLAGSDPDPKKYFAVAFPAAGLLMIATALTHTLRRRKYGISVCRIDRSPIPVGSTVRGEIDTRIRERPEGGFTLRLACVRRTITGSGKSRSTRESVLWQDEQTVEHGLMPSPHGMRVPFRFDIPRECESTDMMDASNTVVWRLEASAEVPGLDYGAYFELPVFRTGANTAEFVHTPITNPSSWTPPKEIVVEPSQITVRSPARAADAIGYVTFLAAWFGALAFFRSFGAPLFVIAFFGAIGVLVLFLSLTFLLGRTTLTANHHSLIVRRSTLGIGGTRSIPASEIERIEPRIGATYGNRTYHDVHAKLRSGRTQKIAKHLRNKRDAEMLAAKVMRMMGR